jgi:hypothetical protein
MKLSSISVTAFCAAELVMRPMMTNSPPRLSVANTSFHVGAWDETLIRSSTYAAGMNRRRRLMHDLHRVACGYFQTRS